MSRRISSHTHAYRHAVMPADWFDHQCTEHCEIKAEPVRSVPIVERELVAA